MGCAKVCGQNGNGMGRTQGSTRPWTTVSQWEASRGTGGQACGRRGASDSLPSHLSKRPDSFI